jgi:hypothetical protein
MSDLAMPSGSVTLHLLPITGLGWRLQSNGSAEHMEFHSKQTTIYLSTCHDVTYADRFVGSKGDGKDTRGMVRNALYSMPCLHDIVKQA